MSDRQAVANVQRHQQRIRRWLPWIALVVWLAVALFGGDAIADALDGRSGPVRAVALVGAWGGWAAAAVAISVASTLSLTVARSIVPAVLPAGVISWVADGGTISAVLLLVLGGAATVLVSTAEFGGAMAQASAYGDETRSPLRPPVGFLVMTIVSWMVTTGLVISGPLLLASHSDGPAWCLVLGGVLTVLACAACAVFPRRWHLLSRRWLVFVPAGLVVHDGVVLAETLMMRRTQVGNVGLALEGTDALDLTGPAPGHVIEISAREQLTAVMAPDRRRAAPRPVARHSFLVAPSRPGHALAEASRRGLPVSSTPR